MNWHNKSDQLNSKKTKSRYNTLITLVYAVLRTRRLMFYSLAVPTAHIIGCSEVGVKFLSILKSMHVRLIGNDRCIISSYRDYDISAAISWKPLRCCRSFSPSLNRLPYTWSESYAYNHNTVFASAIHTLYRFLAYLFKISHNTVCICFQPFSKVVGMETTLIPKINWQGFFSVYLFTTFRKYSISPTNLY